MGRFSKLEWEPDKKDSSNDSGLKSVKEREKLTDMPSKQAEEEIFDYFHYIGKADDYYFRGDFRNSLRMYSRAIQEDNSKIEPWIGQFLCLISLSQLKEADLWISRGLEIFPEDPEILSLRALVYANKGMVKRAIATSDVALSSKKSVSCRTWITRGEILLISGSKNAVMCFDKALETKNKLDWQTPFLIADVFMRQKNFTQGAHYLQMASEINMTNFYIWYKLGMCYERLKFRAKAVEAYQHAIELEPEYKPAHDGLYRSSHESMFGKLFAFIGKIFKKLFSGKKKNNEE